MTEIIYAIDLMSLIYVVIAIPVIITTSKVGWVLGKYLEAMYDLKWRKAKKELSE